jgi:DNA-binding NtrC family response regulator
MLALPQGREVDYGGLINPQRHASVFDREIRRDEVIHEHDDENLINYSKIGEISMADVERSLIEETLKKFGFKKRKTAQALQISERTLYRKIKEYGLQE